MNPAPNAGTTRLGFRGNPNGISSSEAEFDISEAEAVAGVGSHVGNVTSTMWLPPWALATGCRALNSGSGGGPGPKNCSRLRCLSLRQQWQ